MCIEAWPRLPKPLLSHIDPEAIKAKVSQLYKSIYDEINAKLEKEQKAQDAEQSKTSDTATPVPPAELLETAIGNSSKKSLMAHNLILEEDNDMAGGVDVTFPEQFVQAVLKHCRSPSAQAGHNSPKTQIRSQSDWKDESVPRMVSLPTPRTTILAATRPVVALF